MNKKDLPQEVKTYTIEDLMSFFNKSKATIYNWMDSGLLPYRQYPGERRVTVEDLKNFNENTLVKINPKKNSSLSLA